MMLNAQDLSVTLGGHPILGGVSFSLAAGDVLMIVGPNGSGKTTLVRAIMDSVPHGGSVNVCGTDIRRMSLAERALTVGVLTQNNTTQFAYTARDVVAVGRYAHKRGLLGSLTAEDNRVIMESLALTQTADLVDRTVTTLSGGELQRVCLARVFAQNPRILILDEPTNHLDIEHQLLMFDIIGKWVKVGQRAVISIVHDLNIAYAYGSRALLLYKGEVFAQGSPREVLSSNNLRNVYNVDLVAWMKSLLSNWQHDEEVN